MKYQVENFKFSIWLGHTERGSLTFTLFLALTSFWFHPPVKSL